jgi:hypothetical protein
MVAYQQKKVGGMGWKNKNMSLLLTVSNSEIMEVQGGKEDCKLLWSTVAQ